MTVLDTPVGALRAAVTDIGLAEIRWSRRADEAALTALAERLGAPVVTDPDRTAPVAARLGEYFTGTRREFDLPLDWSLATPTQRQVLTTLYDRVGYGQVVTYGGLAELSGLSATGEAEVPARAIGGAMGANPIPIVVPCHRVVASNGIGGYSGGRGDRIEIKRWLLILEGALPPTLDWDPHSCPAAT